MLHSFERSTQRQDPFNKSVSPPFYRLKKNKETHYLLGTCHDLPLQVFPKRFQQVFSEADILMTESLINLKIDGSLVDRNNHFVEGLTYWLSPETADLFWRQSGRILKAFKIDDVDPKDVNPWLLVQLFCVYNQPKMDHQLCSQYVDGQKQVIPLRDSQALLDAVVSKHRDSHINEKLCHQLALELKKILSCKTTPQFEDTKKMYLEDIETHLSQYKIPSSHHKRAILENHSWTDKFSALAAESGGKILLACGAAHLYGDEGILKLMEQKGYRIEKIRPTEEDEYVEDLTQHLQTQLKF